MQSVVEGVQSLTQATGAVVEQLDGDAMVYKACSGAVEPYVDFRIPVSGSVSGLCVEKSKLIYVQDARTDARVNKEACEKVGALSMVVVPLYRQGKVISVLKIISDKVEAFSVQDVQTLELMAGLLGGTLGQQIEVEARRLEALGLQHQALHDVLTGLPNRQLFADRLAQALHRYARYEHFFAVMYMDIDHFKSINDSYGHAVGDALLKAFAERVRKNIRASDTFARLCGDEFVIILDVGAREDIKKLANKIIEAVRPGFTIGAQTVTVSTSIGIAFACDPKSTVDDIVDQADEALYEAKNLGRDQFSIKMTECEIAYGHRAQSKSA